MPARSLYIGIDRGDAVDVDHLEGLRHTPAGARHTHASPRLFEFATATHQHSDTRAIDRVEAAYVNYQLPGAILDQALERVFEGKQHVSQAEPPGNLDNRNIGLYLPRLRFGDHGRAST